MKTNPDVPQTNRPREISDEQIADDFERLGLHNPAVLDFYRQLDAMTPNRRSENFWLRTNIHSIADPGQV